MSSQVEFRLASRAVVGTSAGTVQDEQAPAEDFSNIVRQVSIDKLRDENKRLGYELRPAPL